MERVYLDHNATSPLRPEAREAVRRALEAPAGNASSLHAEGRAARRLLEEARAQVAALAGAEPAEVVFTSGGSEAIAAAIHGVGACATPSRRRIVVSSVEHSSVLESARGLAREGFAVVEAPCTEGGAVRAGDFLDRIDAGTAVAALQWRTTRRGGLPVEEIARACASRASLPDRRGPGGGKVPLPRRHGWEPVALSSHKLGGPQVGALIVPRGWRWRR
jgi:cysteine desulfurase